MDVAAFAVRFKSPVLLGLFSSQDEDSQRFTTIPVDTEPAPSRGYNGLSHAVPDSQVFPLVKKEGVAFADKITVGRTQNNDLVVRDPLVSKLHGFFTMSDGSQVTFTDGGSSNGTLLNENSLTHFEAAPLVSGDKIVFGTAAGFQYLNLVVASKVKEYIKSKEAMMASDFTDALNKEVQALLDKAVERCKSNKRSIVSPKDL
jgi:hypothetical protein